MSRETLNIAAIKVEPVICWPWHLWRLEESEGHPQGGVCRICRRDVAVPRGAPASAAICIYCGLDRGLTPALDEPLT